VTTNVQDQPSRRTETPWRTLPEAAIYCRLSPRTLQDAVYHKQLDASSTGQGGKMVFHIDDLDDWMRRRGKDTDA